ncbi:hypothetical protein [Mesorhizobium sp. M0802]|uniref:hypothetical protein n=1 Tax=Mesorhizobium sp. M0802 TaxID=2957001 RepID=UPI003338CFD3
MLATTKWDDRVHPGHARKMAAKLQALGYPAYFYEPSAGGHSCGKDHRERPHSLPSATISFAVRSCGTPMAFDNWSASNKNNFDDVSTTKLCVHTFPQYRVRAPSTLSNSISISHNAGIISDDKERTSWRQSEWAWHVA